MNLKAVSDAIEYSQEGFWKARLSANVSYPEGELDNSAIFDEESFWFRHRKNCVIELMRHFEESGPIFDIGGGAGYMSKALDDAGYETVLVEPGADGVFQAKSRGVRHVVQATVTDACFKDASIPAIGLFDVIEHFQDDHGLLEEVGRILRPGGRVYATVPAYSLLWSIEDEYVGHFRRYSLAQISDLFRKAGFDIDYASYIFTFLVPPIFILRSIPSFLKLGGEKVKRRRERRNDHLPGSNFSKQLVDGVLAGEQLRVKRLKTIPFGSSCLVVARKSGA